MDAMGFPEAQYQACAGRIVGVTATHSGTLVTVALLKTSERPAGCEQEWIGKAVELLVFGAPAPAPRLGSASG